MCTLSSNFNEQNRITNQNMNKKNQKKKIK